MKSDNKWMMWGLIALVVLNVILLGYIFLGAGGVSLSPTGCDGTIVNVFGKPICTTGSGVGLTELQLFKSKVRNVGSGTLDILSAEQRGIRIAGLDKSNNIVPTYLNLNGSIDMNGYLFFRNNEEYPTLSTTISTGNISLWNYDLRTTKSHKSTTLDPDRITISQYIITDSGTISYKPYVELIRIGLRFLAPNGELNALYTANNICFKKSVGPGYFLCGPDSSGAWICKDSTSSCT